VSEAWGRRGAVGAAQLRCSCGRADTREPRTVLRRLVRLRSVRCESLLILSEQRAASALARLARALL
jgi:hypothetical protein